MMAVSDDTSSYMSAIYNFASYPKKYIISSPNFNHMLQPILHNLWLIETELAKVHTSLPHLPAEWRDLLIKALPWLVLIGGIMSVISVLGVLNIFTSPFGRMYVGYGIWGVHMILTLLSAIVSATAAFLAFPKLQKNEKIGWTYIFGASLVSGIIGILMFSIGSILGTCIGLYLLFEVREHYKN